MAQINGAQPRPTSPSVIDLQSHRLRNNANNYLKGMEQTPEDEFESDLQDEVLERDGTYGVPIWPVKMGNPAFEKQHKKQPRPPVKKTSSASQSTGLKKRSLNKARALDMPPTPTGHDWHVTDGGWNLVRSWSEKDGLMGAKVKKERYAGYLSREAWEVMKEYEYEKIIAQIGQFGRHSRG